MKIGYVRTDTVGYGGAERVSGQILAQLVEQGYEVHVFSRRIAAELEGKVLLHASPKRRKGSRIVRHLAFSKWLAAEVPLCKLDVLLSIERFVPCDVLRAGGGVHRRWMDICNADLPLWKKYFLELSPANRLALRDEKAVFNRQNTRLVISNSQMVADEIIERYQYPADHIKVIHNGCDQKYFCPLPVAEKEQLRQQKGFASDELLVLFAGSGFWRKGADVALEIMARWQQKTTRKIHFVLLGKAENKSFEQLAQNLKLKDTHFKGVIAPDEMRQWYQISDLLLFPTRYDPFANVCLEANACGVPVATSTTNGFAEVITEQNGLVLPENADQAALQLEQYCRKLPSCEQVKDIVAYLTWDGYIQQVIEGLQWAQQFPRPKGLD